MRQALECCHRGWGRVDHHRRRRRGAGDRDAALPARHRPRLEGHGLRRRARPHRRAEDRRLVHGRQDRDRPMITHTLPLDDINRGFALMHCGREHPLGGGLLGRGVSTGGSLDRHRERQRSDQTGSPNPHLNTNFAHDDIMFRLSESLHASPGRRPRGYSRRRIAFAPCL